ncbi:MAG: RNase H family protein [Candidatus Fonsibacter sp.]
MVNKSIGAIGIYFSDTDSDHVGQVIDNEGNKITNQTMELLAMIQAFKIIGDKIQNKLINPNIIYVITDSSVITCMTKWYKLWEVSGWINTKKKKLKIEN